VEAQVNVTLDAAGSYLMADGVQVGTSRVTNGPYNYALDTTTLPNGQHTLQIWAHDTSNMTDLSPTVPITVANSVSNNNTNTNTNTSTTTATTTNTTTTNTTAGSTTTTTSSTYPITLIYPQNGQGVSGTISATASITQTLNSAGSYLMVDGVEVGTRRVTSGPYSYPLDTTTLTPGQHILQVIAFDIGNDTLLSNPATVTVGQ
jgi:hypothetical protein